jgi:hypothetical protein
MRSPRAREKNRLVLRPPDFAAYMAASAFFVSVSGSWPSDG